MGIPLGRATVSNGQGHAAATEALILASEVTRQEEMCENVHFCPDRSETLAKSVVADRLPERHMKICFQ